MSVEVMVRWDRAGLSKLDRFYATHSGIQLAKRIDKALGKEVRGLASPIRGAEKSSGIHNRSGRFYRGIRARKARRRAGEASAWTVGPSGPVAHLLIDGHEIVTPGGRDTGRRAKAYNFVGPVIDRYGPPLEQRIGSEVWADQFR